MNEAALEEGNMNTMNQVFIAVYFRGRCEKISRPDVTTFNWPTG